MSVTDKLRMRVSELLGIDEDEITEDSSFVDDLGADSLDAVELIMDAEEEFGIEIDDDEAEELRTFGQLRAHIEKVLKGRK